MRLLGYTYRKLSLWLLLLMAIWGALFYYTIIDEVVDETDDALANYAQIIINNALYDPSVLEKVGRDPMVVVKNLEGVTSEKVFSEEKWFVCCRTFCVRF